VAPVLDDPDEQVEDTQSGYRLSAVISDDGKAAAYIMFVLDIVKYILNIKTKISWIFLNDINLLILLSWYSA
jgi:uncharacterized UBP type Zn finger protein